ncbi:MAG TPA: tetratricopeptide repeat protein [Candidatus Baltobacteraceae bacterium]|nr:tetratricopeptide repeat protein [Candidatus Baltobacteraceae bacterium]
MPPAFGLAVYRVLYAIAPAPYVASSLAEHALQSGDPAAAARYAVALPASPTRDELLARVALARGQAELALEYFLAAPDVAEVQATAQARAATSPAAGYALERLLERRLALLATHPDDVADAYFAMSQLANRQAWREVPASRRQGFWLYRGMRDLQSAIDLAPFSDKYLIAGANQAMLLGKLDRAESLFARAVDANPGSANAVAGLGTIAFERGDFDKARAYLRRARALNRSALMVRALQRFLRDAGIAPS